MDYITSPSKEGKGHANPFKKLPELGNDREALILLRCETCYLILNRYPYNPGHLLAIPFREVPDLELLTDQERTELFNLIITGKQLLQETVHPDGFNIGFNLGSSAGAGIPTHLHAHIVPRWNGDTNFMTVIGKTRTLPQALEDTWQKLTHHLNRSSHA
jgi:ATP adenylyltransferase